MTAVAPANKGGDSLEAAEAAGDRAADTPVASLLLQFPLNNGYMHARYR